MTNNDFIKTSTLMGCARNIPMWLSSICIHNLVSPVSPPKNNPSLSMSGFNTNCNFEISKETLMVAELAPCNC